MRTKIVTNAGATQSQRSAISTAQIALLIEIAALAIHDFQAQAAVVEAHGLYISALNRAEAKFGRLDGRLDPLDPDHADVIAATKSEYEARQRAKKTAYNVRRRLQTACRKAVGVNALIGNAAGQITSSIN